MKAHGTNAARAATILMFCLGLGSLAAVARGDDKPAPNPGAEKPAASQGSEKSAPTAQTMERPFLGIAVGLINPALMSHLPEASSNGQGLLVIGVLKGSPAEKAGLKVHDILMNYGDQKLFSPRQLIGLVRQDKAGHEVDLNVVHGGKPETVKVTLAARPGGRVGGEMKPQGQLPRQSADQERGLSMPSDWESFDSMTLKKLGKDRFHVEIDYLNKQGTIDHKTFDGSREEIHKAIHSQKDLPTQEARQLLRSLDLPIAEIGSLGMPPAEKVPSQYR
jgi:hypothetical protein